MTVEPTERDVCPLRTNCLIENETGIEAKLKLQIDWAGLGPAPEKIKCLPTNFTHTAAIEGSVGLVVYEGLFGYLWAFGWSNKVFTIIIRPGEPTPNWQETFAPFETARNIAETRNGGFLAYVTIDLHGVSPTLTVIIKYDAA